MNLRVFRQVLVSRTLSLMVLIVGAFSSLTANAAIVVSNTSGTNGISLSFVGQSVTTPTGGPWNNISFNFYLASLGTPSYADGSLFVLTQAYDGTPASLSSSAPGYVGSTNTISNNTWKFSNLTLNPNTQYFFYASSPFPSTLAGSFNNPYPGGILYFSFSSAGNTFQNLPNFDANFLLQGDITAVPEPSSMVLIGVALSGVGLGSWRMRWRKHSTKN